MREIILGNEGEAFKTCLCFAGDVPPLIDVRVRFQGRRTRAEIVIAYLGRGTDDTNINLLFAHEAPETYGRVIIKAALFGEARLVMRGMLAVEPEAKGSDTFLLARALLVSQKARAEIHPYLEIKTDEVRASHGSSIGALNQDALLYLASRGVSGVAAEGMLLAEFFREVAEEMPFEYQEQFFQHGARAQN